MAAITGRLRPSFDGLWRGHEMGTLIYPQTAAARSGQHFNEADAARNVTAEEDAVRVGGVDIDSPRIGLRLRQRELNPFLSLWIEARDHVDLVLADPDVVVLLVDHDRIVAAGL